MAVMNKSVVEIIPTPDSRLYALGDIHGCYDALLALEKKIRDSVKRSGFKNFKIISVGDLCDRGPDTKKVIEHFVVGKQANTHEVVIGNHEMFFLMAFWGLRPDLLSRAGIKPQWFHHSFASLYKSVNTQVEIWLGNGGDAVFKSYDADINDKRTWDRIPSTHLKLLFGAPLVVVTPKAVISHAVIHELDLESLIAADEATLEKSERQVLEAVHRCLWERGLPGSRIDPKRRHISGHTPIETVKRNLDLGTIQIDTGAVYGRRLTAINLMNFRCMGVPSGFAYKRAQRELY